MAMKQHFNSIVSIVSLCVSIALVWLLIFKGEKKTNIEPKVERIIERIQGKDTIIQRYTTKVGNEKKIVDAINIQLNELQEGLKKVKNNRDTVMIIKIQDTIINTCLEENKGLRTIVGYQDSIIVAQRYVINSQDTIIRLNGKALKKAKRQRNWSLVGNAILSGALIISVVK